MNGAAVIHRKVKRLVRQAEYVNTINVRDRVTIDFVVYPGAPSAVMSSIDPKVPKHPTTGAERSIYYKWTRDGHAPLEVIMNSGGITISLPKGSKGILEAFGTTWEITRMGPGVSMSPVNQLRGIQQRLNRLGYHLRKPGEESDGVDNIWGRKTEHAILQFQIDYVSQPGAPAPANQQLHIRGEWNSNTNATFQGNLDRYNNNICPNPTAADSAALQAALRAIIGA
jgi:hypothetical protein